MWSRQGGRGREREYVTHLLRRSYREGGKVKNETLANLSHLPERGDRADPRRAARASGSSAPRRRSRSSARCRPGTCDAALAMARRLELARLLDRSPSRGARPVPGDDLPAGDRARLEARDGRARFAQSTLGEELGVEDADEDDLYAAMDWLLERQERIEDRLARRHLGDGELVLYDVSSSLLRGPHAARWRSWATRATASAARRRSSTGCSATGRAGRSRSRCSAASCTTTRRCRPRSRSSRRASGSRA